MGWISEGWSSGEKQAQNEFKYRARKLGEDFKGMTRYMILVEQGKVDRPVVVSSHQSVTGGGNEMREDERIYQLSRPAALNSNTDDWNPIFQVSMEQMHRLFLVQANLLIHQLILLMNLRLIQMVKLYIVDIVTELTQFHA